MKTDKSYSLDEIADRLAIQDVINRYIWALDEYDFDVMDDVFLPYTQFDMTGGGGIRGRWDPDVKEYFKRNLPKIEDYLHVFTNVQIEFGPDRSTAVTRSKVLAPCGIRDGAGVLRHYEHVGEYLDQWAKMAEGWRITVRTGLVNAHIWGDYPFDSLPGEFAARETSVSARRDLRR